MYVLVSSLQCLGVEANSRVWQRTQAPVGLPLNRGAEECLPNGECSLPRGVTVVLSEAAPHGQSAGVAEDSTGALRCIMSIGLKADGVTGASQGAMSGKQGQETPSGVERIAAFAVAARPRGL